VKLSNSAFESWWVCPTYHALRYQEGLVPDGPEPSYLQFGSRFHSILEAYYTGLSPVGVGYVPKLPPDLDPMLEAEAQAMFESYKAAFPQEPFSVVATEVRFEMPIPDSPHTFIGRMDMIVRMKSTGKLAVFETKTENRNSKRNLPDRWLARHQGSLYCYAASKIYKEDVSDIILNVCTRGSEGKQIGPGFRRDTLFRSPEQISQALKDLTWVANQVETLGKSAADYPRNTLSCVSEKGYKCDYFSKCHMGDSSRLVQIEDPYGYLTA